MSLPVKGGVTAFIDLQHVHGFSLPEKGAGHGRLSDELFYKVIKSAAMPCQAHTGIFLMKRGLFPACIKE